VTEEEPELELDGPWKEVIDWYFPELLLFYFPATHALVDWARGHEFLDQELQQIHPEAEAGSGRVDKLAKVWFLDGSEHWVLIHIEVQNQPQAIFPERMYTYNHRLRDRYGRMPISVAILGDDRFGWRPSEFIEECGGCELRFRFLTAKLLEWSGREEELRANPNPFAAVTLAHLKTLETRGRPDSRQEWKVSLIRGLYDRGYTSDQIRKLFKAIDWIMKLSEARQNEFWDEHKKFEEERKMTPMSPMERMWLKQGVEQGIEQGIEKGVEQGIEKGVEQGSIKTFHVSIPAILERRFGHSNAELIGRIQTITDTKLLAEIQLVAATASDVPAFETELNAMLVPKDVPSS
jgi:hypothetical protein